MKREKNWSLPLLFFCLCGIGVLLFANIAKAEEAEKTTGAKILLQGECGARKAVYDEDDDEFYEYDDEDLPYNVDDVRFTLYEDGTMVISGNGKMEDYEDYEDCCTKYRIKDQMPWYKYRKKIKKLIIEEGITRIGRSNFLGCKNLKTIQWPESLQCVEHCAFENCTGLEEVTLPANVQEWYPVIFRGCTGLRKVTLEKGIQFGEPGGYQYGSGMFMKCTSLETVIFPEDLKIIPSQFVMGCPNIKEYKIPEKLISFGCYPASICPEKVVLPETVQYLTWGAFLDCTNLKELILPEGLLSIGDEAIEGCDNLKFLRIPSTVTSLEYGALQKSGLETVELPEGITKIGDYAFYECKNLKKIRIPDSVTVIKPYAFSGCSNLRKVVLPSNLKELWHEVFSGCTRLKKVVWNPSPEGVFKFWGDSFIDCKKLECFTIPQKTTVLWEQFDDCKNVKVKVLCSSKIIEKYLFVDQKFPQTATLLVPKGKKKKFEKLAAKYETDTYKVRIREMKE